MSPLYEWLLDGSAGPGTLERMLLGINWTMAEVDGGCGFAFSPREVPRTLPWAGTLVGRQAAELRAWLLSWNPAEAAVGLATLNAQVNRDSALLADAQPLAAPVPGHLQVFAHFRPRLAGRLVVVVGRYPGLDELWQDQPYQCLERAPQAGDWPDTAAEYLLPRADWVFVTASSLANKSLPRLLELSRSATVVLMGPSLPWLAGWERFGVDYLAGVRVLSPGAAWQVAAEGGGTRLFAGPVQYALAALG